MSFTVSAISKLFQSFRSLDMLGRCLLCTDSVAAALKLDNILVFSTPKSIIYFVLLHHRFLPSIFLLMILSSAATWQKPKISHARIEVDIPLRRVSNIPLSTHDSRVLQCLCHYHLSSFSLLLELTISLLFLLSIY